MPASTLPVRFLAGIALVTASLLSSAAQAQLYKWRDAQGNTYIKNSPPPWYDDSGWTRGPRVQVLRDRKIVDDTAWPAAKRQEARNKASAEEIKRMQAERAVAPTAKKGEKDDDE